MASESKKRKRTEQQAKERQQRYKTRESRKNDSTEEIKGKRSEKGVPDHVREMMKREMHHRKEIWNWILTNPIVDLLIVTPATYPVTILRTNGALNDYAKQHKLHALPSETAQEFRLRVQQHARENQVQEWLNVVSGWMYSKLSLVYVRHVPCRVSIRAGATSTIRDAGLMNATDWQVTPLTAANPSHLPFFAPQYKIPMALALPMVRDKCGTPPGHKDEKITDPCEHEKIANKDEKITGPGKDEKRMEYDAPVQEPTVQMDIDVCGTCVTTAETLGIQRLRWRGILDRDFDSTKFPMLSIPFTPQQEYENVIADQPPDDWLAQQELGYLSAKTAPFLWAWSDGQNEVVYTPWNDIALAHGGSIGQAQLCVVESYMTQVIWPKIRRICLQCLEPYPSDLLECILSYLPKTTVVSDTVGQVQCPDPRPVDITPGQMERLENLVSAQARDGGPRFVSFENLVEHNLEREWKLDMTSHRDRVRRQLDRYLARLDDAIHASTTPFEKRSSAAMNAWDLDDGPFLDLEYGEAKFVARLSGYLDRAQQLGLGEKRLHEEIIRRILTINLAFEQKVAAFWRLLPNFPFWREDPDPVCWPESILV